MTPPEVAIPPEAATGPTDGSAADDASAALVALVATAARLLAVPVPGPHPVGLRVRLGAVVIDVEWPARPGPAVVGPVPEAPPAPPAGDDGGWTVDHFHAPLAGVFYRRPQPGAPPFVEAGDAVVEGQQVGIVEAMKLMVPVTADRAGRVLDVLTDEGAAVELGERLFSLVPEPERTS